MTSLSKNVKFSIEKNSDEGSFVVRSKTESFNLDHVVDKDIISFYGELSKYGIVDTGILPLSGTGILAIRSAGNHCQITFQHAPQINYINWGTYEGDPNAKTYLVAQPYRIWIGDMIDGNLYGARMFYSPYPITSATQQLYHLNLPNTNCKGYRGNGVGWQCLYHKDDWSNLPFNEKVVRFAERCSGVEAFNDNNMSETDGPRFYRDYHNEDADYEYLWNPLLWQKKTEEDGIDWVLSEDTWIPVLVSGLDDQAAHNPSGQPLTLGMAMVGNYRAYYSDNYIPKPINALTRSDLADKVTSETVASWIMRSHNSSKTSYVPKNSIDESTKHREHVLLNSPKKISITSQEEEEEEDNSVTIICPISGDPCSVNEDDTMVDALDNVYCPGCFEENAVYCENTDAYLPANSDYIYYHDADGNYYDVRDVNYGVCDKCSSFQSVPSHNDLSSVIITNEDGETICCVSCLDDHIKSNYSENSTACYQCSCVIPLSSDGDIHPDWIKHYNKSTNVYLNTDSEGNDIIVSNNDFYCNKCYDKSTQCPTGHRTWIPLAKLPSVVANKVYTFIDSVHNAEKKVRITHMCATCANPEIWQGGLSSEQINQLSTFFSVITKGEERFRYAFEHSLIANSPYISYEEAAEQELPF